jgi:hypothetical protein
MMEPTFENVSHPNAIPVVPRSLAELQALGREMMEAATKNPTDEPQQYSNNEVEMMERFKKMGGREHGLWMMETGLTRSVMLERTSVISLCLTYEAFAAKPCYRLSMVRHTGPMQTGPIPAEWAELLAKAVFGEKAEKVPNPSGFEFAQHWLMYAEKPVE